MRPAAAYASAATYRPKAAYDSSVYNRTTRIHAYLHAPRTQILSARIALRAIAAPRMSAAFCARADHTHAYYTCRARCAHPHEHACASRSGQLGRHIPRACAHTLPNKHTHITCALRGSLFYNKAVERQCAPHNLPYRAMSVPPASAGGVSPSPYRGAVQRKLCENTCSDGELESVRDRPTQPPYQRGSGVR